VRNNKKIHAIKKPLLILAVVAMFIGLSLGSVSRASAFQCPDGGPDLSASATLEDCPKPITIDCDPKPEGAPLDRTNCGILNLIVIGINVLSAIAGIVFVASVMIAGFQYMTAQDNAGQIQKARSRIVMTLVALAIFIFMYAILNFLIPGGVIPR